MIQNLILSIGLSFAIGLNGAKDNHDNFINNDTPNNVVYDDESYLISLNINEVNNYTWNNLNSLRQYASIDDLLVNTYIWLNDDDDNFTYEDIQIVFDGEGTYQNYFYFIYESNSNYLQFNSGIDDNSIDPNNINKLLFSTTTEGITILNWQLNNNNYQYVKNAIELDIQANTTQASMGNTIINAIKSGLGLIVDLASQFLLGFSTLFWANNALTPFATFSLVLLGIAITMAVVSLVLKIIRGNTGA